MNLRAVYRLKIITKLFCLLWCSALFWMSCSPENQTKKITEAKAVLKKSFLAFKAGDNDLAKTLSHEVLSVGKTIKHDTLTGFALMNLGRTALRVKNKKELKLYTAALMQHSKSCKDRTWEMFAVHLNAEYERIHGNFSKAKTLYLQSMALSKSLGQKSTYAVEHFNLAMVEMEDGKLETAKQLLQQYYILIKELNPDTEDVYGLIPLANLLMLQNNVHAAAEVAMVARRLFTVHNIVPDPADESPLLHIEKQYQTTLSKQVQDSIVITAARLSESDVLNKYL